MFNQVSWSSRPVFGQTSQVKFGSTWSSCSKGRRSSSINPKAAQPGSDGSRTNMYSVVKPVCSDPKKGPNWQFVPYHPEFEIKMSTCNSHLTSPLSRRLRSTLMRHHFCLIQLINWTAVMWDNKDISWRLIFSVWFPQYMFTFTFVLFLYL